MLDWLRRRPTKPALAAPEATELARAAQVLALRSKRESAGLLSGVYASAFRGSGMEFDESRPYSPGDDPRHFDWNAMARTGEPYVKHYREERDLTVLLGLDVSGSMAFGQGGRSKALVGAHVVALLAAAAGRTGDRVGFFAFDEHVRNRVAPARGAAHTWKLIRHATEAAIQTRGPTRFAAAVEGALALSSHRCVTVLVSDFRAGDFPTGSDPDLPGDRTRFQDLSRRHDLVSIVITDPREEVLPRAGRVRVDDPEHPGRPVLVDTGSARSRARYETAWQRSRAAQDEALRRAGSDVVHLRSDRDPLRALIEAFQRRASSRSRAA